MSSTGSNGTISDDGACPLMVFLPFTEICDPLRVYQSLMPDDNGSFDHLAAALMAMEQFNSRNPSVISELADPIFQNCTSHFPMNSGGLEFIDTEAVVVVSVQAVYDRIMEGQNVCALVGTICDGIAIEVSTQASGLEIPLVIHGSRDNRLSSPRFYPHTTRTCMNRFYEAEVIYGHLRDIGRGNFIANVFNIQELGTQIQETIETELVDANVQHFESTLYSPPFTGTAPGSVYFAMNAAKESGFRTIIITVTTDEHLKLIADSAEALGLNNGDYYYVITGDLSNDNIVLAANNDKNITKLVQGSAVMSDLDGFTFNPPFGRTDPFLQVWKSQGPDFVQRVQAFDPIPPGRRGYVNATSTYFQDNNPTYLSAYMFDAIMSVGFGHCRQQLKDQGIDPDSFVSEASPTRRARRVSKKTKGVKGMKAPSSSSPYSQHHRATKKTKSFQGFITNKFLESILESDFLGATGPVKYNEGDGFRPTNRVRELMTYGRYNFRTKTDADGKSSMEYVLTDVLTDGTLTGTWTQVPGEAFVYADGGLSPPELLRDPPPQNLLSSGVFATGITLCAIGLVWTLLATVFVVIYRSDQVVKGNQPVFLIILLAGALGLVLSILTLSFDEGRGLPQEDLTALCTATPWLIALGFIIIYCAMFSKLWRINKVLQYRTRARVTVVAVMGPFLVMVVAMIGVLSAWTAVDPLTWKREEINFDTGESFGRCRSQNSAPYLASVGALMFMSALMTCFMAWQTKDVDERFSESKWIFYTVVSQIQILAVGLPILALIDTDNANVTYVARIMLVWLVVMTTVTVMFVPKALKVFFGISFDSAGVGRGQIAGGEVKISGLTTMLPPDVPERRRFVSGSNINTGRSSSRVQSKEDSMDDSIAQFEMQANDSTSGFVREGMMEESPSQQGFDSIAEFRQNGASMVLNDSMAVDESNSVTDFQRQNSSLVFDDDDSMGRAA